MKGGEEDSYTTLEFLRDLLKIVKIDSFACESNASWDQSQCFAHLVCTEKTWLFEDQTFPWRQQYFQNRCDRVYGTVRDKDILIGCPDVSFSQNSVDLMSQISHSSNWAVIPSPGRSTSEFFECGNKFIGGK